MADMTREQVQELLDSATPGPWRFSNSSDTTGMKGEFRAPSPMNGFMLVCAYVNEGDPALIAVAPDVFRWALERDQAATDAKAKLADVWDEAYRLGVEDERTAAAWDTGDGPNRVNPYLVTLTGDQANTREDTSE